MKELAPSVREKRLPAQSSSARRNWRRLAALDRQESNQKIEGLTGRMHALEYAASDARHQPTVNSQPLLNRQRQRPLRNAAWGRIIDRCHFHSIGAGGRRRTLKHPGAKQFYAWR